MVDPDEEGEQDGEEAVAAVPPPAIPTMFRWISTSKPDSPALSFSVPPSLMPDPETVQRMNAGPPPETKGVPTCDVGGCGLPRKYKLVKDPTRGGCGMEHLKALQAGTT